MTADTVAAMLAEALHAPDVDVRAEQDGRSVYLFAADGSIVRVDVHPIVDKTTQPISIRNEVRQ